MQPSTFCSAERGEDQVQEFLPTHKVPSAERGLQQSLERIHDCADLKSQTEPRAGAVAQRSRSERRTIETQSRDRSSTGSLEPIVELSKTVHSVELAFERTAEGLL